EDVVADQRIEEFEDLFLEFERLVLDLHNRVRESVGQLHVAAFQFPDKFDVVITGDTERDAVTEHRHHQAPNVGSLPAAIHQVSDEDSFAAIGRRDSRTLRATFDLIAKLFEQRGEFVIATVDIADDVERTVLLLAVVPEWLAGDLDAGKLIWTGEYKDMP